jgi:hypothetical protein
MTAFGGTREPDAYSIILQALRYTAQEAAMGGMPEVADTYLLVIDRLASGDLELQPKRRLVR